MKHPKLWCALLALLLVLTGMAWGLYSYPALMARGALKLGQFDAAEQLFRREVRLRPNQWEGWRGLMETQFSAGRVRGAADLYREASAALGRDQAEKLLDLATLPAQEAAEPSRGERLNLPDYSPVSMTIWNYQNFDLTPATRTAMEQFEQEKNVSLTVETGWLLEEEKRQRMEEVAAGQGPDIACLPVGWNVFPAGFAAEYFVPVEEIRGEFPGYAENYRLGLLPTDEDGAAYALPKRGSCAGLYVNRNVLERCGISLPEQMSWKQFLAVCEIVRQRGYIPVAMPGQGSQRFWLDYAILNESSSEEVNILPQKVNDPAFRRWKAALEELCRLSDLGFLPARTVTEKETRELVSQNMAAFYLGSSDECTEFEVNMGSRVRELAFCPVPGTGNRPLDQGICTFPSGYYILRSSWDDPARRPQLVDLVTRLTQDQILRDREERPMPVDALELPMDYQAAPLRRRVSSFCGQLTQTSQPVTEKLSVHQRQFLLRELPKILRGESKSEDILKKMLSLENDGIQG